MQLLLKGVFHGSDETAVGAVITGKSGPSFYPLGATIDEGVVLKQVLANAVVLEREGFPEVLEFAQQWGHQAVANKAPALNATLPSSGAVEKPSPGLDQRLQQWRRASQSVEQ
ncbi:MAG: type II secretion system protein N [Porticoccaceae bacterium]